jgi:hypothetical protein
VVLGSIPGTELYKDIMLYKDVSSSKASASERKFFSTKKAREHNRIKIIRIEESLHYTNSRFFKNTICKLANIRLEKELERKKKAEKEKPQNSRVSKSKEPVNDKDVLLCDCRFFILLKKS